MIHISHRGNVNGRNEKRENTCGYIQEAISLGYDVEIDVWMKENKFFLGHDSPEGNVEISWLIDKSEHLLIHAKNFDALSELTLFNNLRLFFHEKESHTIIYGTKFIWSHDISEASDRSIIPLLSEEDIKNAASFLHVAGICSDYIGKLKQ